MVMAERWVIFDTLPFEIQTDVEEEEGASKHPL